MQNSLSLHKILVAAGSTPRSDKELRLCARSVATALSQEPRFDRAERARIMLGLRTIMTRRWMELGRSRERADADADMLASLIQERLT
jgi:hypothetical protein